MSNIIRYPIKYYQIGGDEPDNTIDDQPAPLDTIGMIESFTIPSNIVPSDILNKAKEAAKSNFFKNIISTNTLKNITNSTEMYNTVIKYATYTVRATAGTAATVGSLGAGGDTVVDGSSLIFQYFDFSRSILYMLGELGGGLSWLKTIWDYCNIPGAFKDGPEGIRAYVSASFQKEKTSGHPNFIVALCTLFQKIMDSINKFFGDILSFGVPDDGGIVSIVVQETLSQVKSLLSPFDVIENLYNLIPNFMKAIVQNYDSTVNTLNNILDYIISLVTGLYYVNDTVFSYIFHPFDTAGAVISTTVGTAFHTIGTVTHAVFHPIQASEDVANFAVDSSKKVKNAVVESYKITKDGIQKAKDMAIKKSDEAYEAFKKSSPLAKAGIVTAVGVGFALSPIIITVLPELAIQGFATSQYLITIAKAFGVTRDSCLKYINEDLRKRIPGLVQLMQGTLGFVFALLVIIDECGGVQTLKLPGK